MNPTLLVDRTPRSETFSSVTKLRASGKGKLSLIILRKATANQHAALPSTGSMDARSVIKLGSLEKTW